MKNIKFDENILREFGMKFADKPPLGVTPKHIYEIQRVQELCRALYEYSNYEYTVNKCDLMREWADELLGRLNELKFDLELKSENTNP